MENVNVDKFLQQWQSDLKPIKIRHKWYDYVSIRGNFHETVLKPLLNEPAISGGVNIISNKKVETTTTSKTVYDHFDWYYLRTAQFSWHELFGSKQKVLLDTKGKKFGAIHMTLSQFVMGDVFKDDHYKSLFLESDFEEILSDENDTKWRDKFIDCMISQFDKVFQYKLSELNDNIKNEIKKCVEYCLEDIDDMRYYFNHDNETKTIKFKLIRAAFNSRLTYVVYHDLFLCEKDNSLLLSLCQSCCCVFYAATGHSCCTSCTVRDRSFLFWIGVAQPNLTQANPTQPKNTKHKT